MATAKNKTIETEQSVAAFIKTIADDEKRADFSAILNLISAHIAIQPKMWGTAIVGFGSYHYKYESGREGDAPLAGVSPRANSITFYIGCNFDKAEELLSKLGKYKLSGGCLHIKKLEDIDTCILVKLIEKSIEHKKTEHAG